MADPPEIVRLLQILYFIAAGGMAISGVLDILVALSALSSPNLRPLVAHRLTGALIGLGSGGFYFALARSFGHGRRLAYYTQVLLASLCIASGIGCFWVGSLLIVALVNAAILYFWLRPGPKAWFEIEGRPSLTASTTLN